MLDAMDRLRGDHVDEVLDIADRPHHVEVHTEFGTNVFLTGAYMGRDEGEARRSETCTQFVKQCGAPVTTVWLLHTGLEPPLGLSRSSTRASKSNIHAVHVLSKTV
jgi:hypothetical protein